MLWKAEYFMIFGMDGWDVCRGGNMTDDINSCQWTLQRDVNEKRNNFVILPERHYEFDWKAGFDYYCVM